MAREIKTETSKTFMEFRLLPRLTTKGHAPDSIDLKASLTRSGLCLNIPLTSAVMQSVSGPELAIALAREGGISFIFCSQPIEDQAEMIRKVKTYKAGFVVSDSNLSPEQTLRDVLELTEKTGHSTIPVTDDGSPEGVLMGMITDMDYWPTDDPDTKVKDIMTPIDSLAYGEDGISLKEANEILRKAKKSCIPILDKKRLKYLVFKKDYLMHKSYPLELLDEEKRLMVGAGINTRDYKERVPALHESGCDVLVVDTSDGYSEYVSDTIKWVKKNYPDLPVGAGNVVTAEGFRYLADAGADFVKVGIGGGSICITQEQKGIGRGQASALSGVVAARDEYKKKTGEYVPICSDGGLVQDSNILMSLAFGADFVMMGRYFARFRESPTPIKEMNGKQVKPYWGEGSERARNWQRYYTGGGTSLKFEEGVDGFVSFSGTLKDNVEKTLAVIKSTMGNIGCKDIPELHDEAIIEPMSTASIREGKAHDIMLHEDDRISW
ncbi:MAG: IMP dehydrogenase [Candidatus Woesearchaeota archaeon]